MAGLLENLINDELRWREIELALLKAQLLRDIPSQDHFAVSYRSFVAITYAHYEGFTKVCFAQALSDIFNTGIKPSACIEPLKVHYFAQSSRKLLSKLSNPDFVKALCASASFLDQSPLPSGDEILEISNLNVPTFLSMTASFGITIHSFSRYRRSVGRLVDLRHRCAHGERLTFDSTKTNSELATELFDIQANVILLMHATALALLELFETSSFAAPI